MIVSKNPEFIQRLVSETTVWDNHTCMPLRLGDDEFLPQLARIRASGVNVVSLNVTFDIFPWETAFSMLATFRHWVSNHGDEYVLAASVNDIEAAKRNNQLAILFDIEGGKAVEPHPGLVEIYYQLGVRWMLIAFNNNNRLGGGCQDDDIGLTEYGRTIIDQMERVGMVLCCSHTGYQTALEAMAYANNPVIFSHSNPRALYDHERNIPDELMKACAATGGVVNINGLGIFLGGNDSSTENILRHIDYTAALLGCEHVGLGLDYVFDMKEIEEGMAARPDIFPPEKGYDAANFPMVEPERIPKIAEGLLAMNYSDNQVQGILGHNNLRVADQVWK